MSKSMQFFKNTSICIRKTNLFNKGRYSRTRQIVRGTFFFSLLLNVNVIFGTLLIYYLYTIKLSYLWWFFFGFLSCFIMPATMRQTSKRFMGQNYIYFCENIFQNQLFRFFNVKQYSKLKAKYL